MKDKAKVFMFIAIGLLAISLAVQSFTLEATAQGEARVVHAWPDPTTPNQGYAITDTGDVYHTIAVNNGNYYPWTLLGNIFSGSVPAQGKSVSDIKAKW